MADLHGATLDESDRRATARDLVNRNRLSDALWLREHTASDFPQSSWAHGDLGESYLAANLRQAAERELTCAVEIDPKNLRAANFLKLIRDGLFPWPSEKGRITLRLKGHLDAKEVFAAGSFNLWDEHALPMVPDAEGWTVRFDLPAGQYEYRFVLDGTLIPDPDNPRHKDPNDSLSASLLSVEGQAQLD